MAHDLLDLLARANLVLAAAIVFVLLVRAPMRRWFGARVAYALWIIPPLAAAMCFAPPRTLVVNVPAPALSPLPAPVQFDPPLAPAPLEILPFDLPLALLAIWIGVALAWLAILALRQRRFVNSLGRLAAREELGVRVFGAETRCAGPALIGFIRPVIVTPADFEERYTEEERWIMLAHERAHMRQGDPIINALAAFLQCVCWFNPLIHAGVRALRVDQELACDAAVLASSHAARRSYAEALLKTQIAPAPSPLGCAWPPVSLAAFKERIAMLKRNLPSRTQTVIGGSVLAIVAGLVAVGAWSAQPPRIVADAQAHANGRAGAELPVAALEDAVDVEDAADSEDAIDIEVEIDDVENEINDEIDVNIDLDIDAGIDDEVEIALLGSEAPAATDEDGGRTETRRVIVRPRTVVRLTPAQRAEIDAAIERARAVSREAIERGRLTAQERAEINAAVARAREISREAVVRARPTPAERAAIDTAVAQVRVIARDATERARPTPAERARIAQDVARVRVMNREEIARIRQEAREAAREARVHHGQIASADIAEIRRQASALAERAVELAAMSVAGDEADEAARDAAVAELEASVERLKELVERVQADAARAAERAQH